MLKDFFGEVNLISQGAQAGQAQTIHLDSDLTDLGSWGLKRKYKLILVAGARPNFMKIAPIMHTLENHPGIEPVLVHMGQHYDGNVSADWIHRLRRLHRFRGQKCEK